MQDTFQSLFKAYTTNFHAELLYRPFMIVLMLLNCVIIKWSALFLQLQWENIYSGNIPTANEMMHDLIDK